MKKIIVILCVLLPLLAVGQGGKKLLIGGSYWGSVAIMDRASGVLEWRYELPVTEATECNSVSMVGNDVLVSYKSGARLVRQDGSVAWDFVRENAQQEIHTAIAIKGGFMLGVCGFPMQIIELDKNGKEVKRLSYDLGIDDLHSQFRRMTKTRDGHYLVPLIGRGKVLELSAEGKKVNEFEVGGSPFAVSELVGGNLLVGCGNRVAEFTRAGELVVDVAKGAYGVDTMRFLTEASRLKNGNTLITNWQGHDADTDAQILEINPKGEVVWRFENKKDVGYVSTLFPF